MAGLSSGGGMSAKGGDSGDATSGGNIGVTIGGFNAPKQGLKNEQIALYGLIAIGLAIILTRRKKR